VHVGTPCRRERHHDVVEKWSGDHLVAEVERLGARGLPYGELHAELAARIRRALPVDAFCWHGLDPDTRLLTTANPVELMTGGFLTPETEAMAAGAVVTSEYLRDDVNTFAALAARRTPVGVLSETTRGRPERSARYVEYLRPIGTPYEMRAAMVTRGRAWGCVVLHRTERTGDFTPDEARLLARLSRPVAEALRSSYRVDAARRADEDRAPGLLVLDAHDDVELTTPAADALLSLLILEDPAHRNVPAAVLSIAAEVRRQGRVGRPAPPLHAPTSSGWLTLYGSLPGGGTDGRVAIVVQRADADLRGSVAPGGLRADRARAGGRHARRSGARHRCDRRASRDLVVDRPGPSQGRLREDGHPLTSRAAVPGVLPRPAARDRRSRPTQRRGPPPGTARGLGRSGRSAGRRGIGRAPPRHGRDGVDFRPARP